MTAVNKLIKPTWTKEQIQEVTSHALVNNCIAINKLLDKLTPELHHEYLNIVCMLKIDYYKTLNIKTPMDLAVAMAEYDTNVFGSKIGITGEINKVTIEIETCGCWNIMQKNTCFTPELGEKLGENYKTINETIIKELGFTGHVDITPKGVHIHINT